MERHEKNLMSIRRPLQRLVMVRLSVRFYWVFCVRMTSNITVVPNTPNNLSNGTAIGFSVNLSGSHVHSPKPITAIAVRNDARPDNEEADQI